MSWIGFVMLAVGVLFILGGAAVDKLEWQPLKFIGLRAALYIVGVAVAAAGLVMILVERWGE